MKELDEKIRNAQHSKTAFVIYRKPNSKQVTCMFENSSQSMETVKPSGKRFVFAPFDNTSEEIIISYANSEVFSFEIKRKEHLRKETELIYSEEGKMDHIRLVEKGIEYIRKTNLDKVVLSRKEEVSIPSFKVLETFQKMCELYPNAFVYLWSHPISGIWMGASPERLLTVTNNKFKVMALASTQKYEGAMKVEWGEKEIIEHQIVIDYILDKIQDFKISVSDTYTVKAGELLHLRADLEGHISSDHKSLEPLINVLHPTPAVCGLPKEESKSFILDNEQYNREYYTGFLGELDTQEADLFVNLRCMKIDLEKSSATLYVGGGITKDSNPEKEWLETVAKTNVMKKVLL